VSSSIAGRIFL